VRPSFGGGFKAGLRGSSPVATLVQGDHLRRTVWLNILSEETLMKNLPWHEDTAMQKPTWIEPIKTNETIPIQRIGFLRGLFWQPAHIELHSTVTAESCSCCGSRTDKVFTAFNKAKFGYTITGVGTWPHPHSPRITIMKKGQRVEKFVSFTTSAPAWTQLSRFVVQQQMDETNAEGQQPASVILQARNIYGDASRRLHLLVGGYRNNQASILERHHNVFTLNHGWDQNTKVINALVSLGVGYKRAVTSSLFFFCKGLKDNKTQKVKLKGLGEKIELSKVAESQFYRRSEPIMEDTISRIAFDAPELEMAKMRKTLKQISKDIFEESVRPYLNDPELIRTLAVARRTLYKHLNNLEPQQGKGGKDGATEAT
jgi:CRISPR system Cascade subunit CasA